MFQVETHDGIHSLDVESFKAVELHGKSLTVHTEDGGIFMFQMCSSKHAFYALKMISAKVRGKSGGTRSLHMV